jgi:HK97 family phage major capsid protein
MTMEELLAELRKSDLTTSAAIDRIEKELKAQAEQANEIERKLNKRGFSALGAGDAGAAELKAAREGLAAFARGDAKGMSEAHAKVAELTGRKDMSIGSDPNGGYTVHPVVATRLLQKLYDLVPMRRLATIETISEGDAFELPIDRDEPDAQWTGETETRNETATPEVGVLRTTLNELYALPKVTQKLLDMSSWDIAGWLERKMSDKFARTEGAAFVTGNGIRKPRGFMTADTSADGDSTRAYGDLQYVISAAATTITADSLRDLYWTLRAPYRTNAAWMMSSIAANVVDKLKDGNGNYLWRDSMAAGQPPTLLGRPVEFSEDMPAVEAGTFPIAFGDFRPGYLIVDSTKMVMLRDPFTQKGWVKFYANRYVGGSVQDSDAIKLLKVAAS